MDRIGKMNVVHKLQKRGLLTAINCVAGLSIFFFGYDQGMMGGVNGAPVSNSQVNLLHVLRANAGHRIMPRPWAGVTGMAQRS